jgi:hypothetical protein
MVRDGCRPQALTMLATPEFIWYVFKLITNRSFAFEAALMAGRGCRAQGIGANCR